MAIYTIQEDEQSMAQGRRYQIMEALANMDGETATDLITQYWGRCLLEDIGFYYYLIGAGYIETKTLNYNGLENQ